MKLAIVYDNRTLDPHLSPGRGFPCLVGNDLLFDTGGDGSRLLSNIGQMGLDIGVIKTGVLSHAHGDHSGGLAGLLVVNKNLTVYLLRSFPTSFKKHVRARAKLVEGHEPMEIARGIWTTAELDTMKREPTIKDHSKVTRPRSIEFSSVTADVAW